jgi:hypothetical protein
MVLPVAIRGLGGCLLLHGMQGVSGSNPLGSIEKPNPTFLLRQSKLKVESPREVFAHWVNIRVSPTPSKSRSPAGRMLLPQLRVSRHAGSLMGHVSFTELLGDIVHRSLPLRRLIRVY